MPRRSSKPTRFLTTVLFTDVVDSTKLATKLGDRKWGDLLDRYHSAMRGLFKRHGGQEIDTAGDGVLSLFDVPVSAVICALDASEKVKALGFKLRSGVHTGECERTADGVAGIAVHVASRVASLAGPGEVLVTTTVEGLVTGSAVTFTSKGTHTLKGVPGKWPLASAKKKQAKKQDKSAAIRLMLVDDHPMWRETLRKVIEGNRVGKVVAEAGNGEEALEFAEKLKPEVALMDIDLPVMNGIEATRRLLESWPDTKVLMLAASDEKSRVVDAVRAGASGYLLKTAQPAEVVDAVRRVREGEMVFPPALAGAVLEELRTPPDQRQTPRLRLVLADGAALFRRGLARVLEDAGFEIAGEAGDLTELLTLIESDPPDMVIIDRKLPPATSDTVLEVTSFIKSNHPGIGLLVLSQGVDPSSAVELLEGGPRAIGYLLKDRVSDVDQLGDAIRRVAVGELVVDPEVASGLAARRRERDSLTELTDREREILALMVEGRSNQAICERLFLAPKTVEGHISHIFTKLGLEPAGDDHRRVLAVLTYLRSA